VISLFSEFEPQVKIEATNSKTFDRHSIPRDIYEIDGLVNYSEVIEEIAIIKHDKKFDIGILKGVEEPFLEMTDMKGHLLDGVPMIQDQYGPMALVGAGLLIKLGGEIYSIDGPPETFTIYSLGKNKKIKLNDQDFKISSIPVVGTFDYNNNVNDHYLVVPIDFAADIMDYGDQITMVEMEFREGTDLTAKKTELLAMLGKDFTITTHYDQNKVIYQTSSTEKWMATFLLAFIFFLTTFSMVASITMLVMEKKENLNTMRAMGARISQLVKIFFYEGLLINGFGLLSGLAIGYGLCYLQQVFGIIGMEASHSDRFPVAFKFYDLLLILGITGIIGILAAYLPSKFLVKRILLRNNN
jgi:ABC-type lipoprotein release transport system permease subunit